MEALQGIRGNMLQEPTKGQDTSQPVHFRQPSSYHPLNTFKLSKERSYQQQYGDMYFLRLMRIKPAVELIAEEAWRETVIGGEPAKKAERVLDVRQGELCWVVGTCYMDMPLKPNILEDVSRDRWISAPISTQKYASSDPEDDKIMLEDDSGRIRLVGDHLENIHLVTGAIIAALGTENVNGELEVLEIKFPDLAPQPERWKLSVPTKPKFKAPKTEEDVDMMDVDSTSAGGPVIGGSKNNKIAIVSGLNFSSTDLSHSLETNLLIDFLLGESLDPSTQAQVSNISRLIVAGNSISMPDPDADRAIEGTKEIRKKYGYDASAYNPVPSQLFDQFLAEILPSIPVTVLPGPNDPANASFPQQPIHTAMFPHSRRWVAGPGAPKASKTAESQPPAPPQKPSWLDLTTNPMEAEIEGWRFLGSSGQNVDDIHKYLSDVHSSDRVGMMEAMCRWRCSAPTAPDTLWSYPFQEDDPFVMEECPHFFFAGCQPEFGTRRITREGEGDRDGGQGGQGGQEVRLVSVPSFSEKKEVVLVDCETLEVGVIRFDIGG
ncbi:hypothetical protein MKZ38_008961 [Zalerion maritima]|uniref:DNA-directed DNA polymerase n=1 Tax=Zalerion maritima TaxID=339359 RepID=A0AAD5RTW9_9PEZI|nr:hypothetical protein MKZ38_008961 [Zalerion maritima]